MRSDGCRVGVTSASTIRLIVVTGSAVTTWHDHKADTNKDKDDDTYDYDASDPPRRQHQICINTITTATRPQLVLTWPRNAAQVELWLSSRETSFNALFLSTLRECDRISHTHCRKLDSLRYICGAKIMDNFNHFDVVCNLASKAIHNWNWTMAKYCEADRWSLPFVVYVSHIVTKSILR